MHDAAYDYVRWAVTRYGPFQNVLDLGGRDVNGSPRDLFSGATYTVLDIMDGEGVDVVADAADWRSDGQFDCVVCCETLEHTPRGPEIVGRTFEHLLPSGIAIYTMASRPRLPHSAYDGSLLREGEYYSNIGPESLKKWFENAGIKILDLEVKQIPDHGGDLYATGIKE